MLPESKEIITMLMVQFDMPTYASFYDHPWGVNERKRVDGTKLGKHVDSLCLMWKSAANTHSLPYLMTKTIAAYSNGLNKGADQGRAIVLDNLAEALFIRLKDELTVTKRNKIRGVIKETAQLFASPRAEPETTEEAWWDRLTQEKEIQLTMFSSAALCYCAVVFAYECFVTDCFRLLTGNAKLWTNDKEFWKELNAYITDPKATYWSTAYITMARETRNCIAHNGSKANDKLKTAINAVRETNEKIHVGADDMISVQAADNHFLFRKLSVKISALIDEVLPKLPPP